LQLCIERTRTIFPPSNILIITNAEYSDVIREHLPDIPADNIIGEPVGRDTANTIGLAAGIIQQMDSDSAMAVFSADQIIEPVENLKNAICSGFEFLNQMPDALLTLAIKPTSAHTGLGYLKRGKPTASTGIYEVERFKEKPDIKTAQTYLASGDYYWNSGLFLWKTAAILDRLNRYLPENTVRLKAIAKAWNTGSRQSVFHTQFASLPKISIDYGVMEKSDNVYMVLLNCRWEDVGSYEAIAKWACTDDKNNNKISPQSLIAEHESGHNIIINKVNNHLVAVVDIHDLVIVHMEDATLICPRGQTDKIKALYDQMKIMNLDNFL
jgi:mannose-1-phosphate guanylyltransferase